MTLLRHAPRGLWLICALLCAGWPAAARAADSPDCHRLVGDTISCTDKSAGDAPSNTERSEPGAPPSESVIRRLIEAAVIVPPTPPSKTVELLDTTERANFASGRDELTPVATAKLDEVIASLRDAHVTRVLVKAHTDSERLVRYAKVHFKTNQRLSEARAARVVGYLQAALGLPDSAFAIQGFGASKPIASNATKAGRARNRRAEVVVWSEHIVPPQPVVAPPPPPPVESVVSTCIGDGADQIAPVRITVDGKPLDSREGANEADRQRCVDVALARADIQVRYDPLEQAPFLNVVSLPQTAIIGEPVRFTTYTNYQRYIVKAEMRVFAPDQSTQQTPLAVIPVAIGEAVDWTPPPVAKSLLHITTALEKTHHLNYLLRVYDRDGRFDETKPRRLDIIQRPQIESVDIDAAKLARDTERVAYGENTLVLRNIPVHGGAVTVNGSNVPPGDNVTVMGMHVPVDDEHKFVARQILPGGPQQVRVTILNARGEGLEFTRNLTIATDDSFFVGFADLTAGSNIVTGPIDLVTSDPNLTHHDYVNGQLAFYYKGLIKGQWLLTAAADTQDQPLRDLFSNFASKDPEYLLRRLDPDKYYPVYGDDGTTVQDAPTSGKFYVRLERGDSQVLWGDFKTQMTGTEFIQYARTLYGLDLRYRSPESTTFGEKQTSVDAFAADSGTLGSRQEFRGTGGSVYYLQYQDVSVGSEQIWVQVRDKDSGIVMSQTQLVPAQDYEMNYMQGRVLLTSPLPSTANTETFVHTGGLDGDPVYLVVTYEYVPDFSSISALSIGGHASEWFGDHWQLGLSSFHQGDPGEEQDLRGIDGTWRYMPGTYIKAEYAHSDGAGAPTLTSITGGLSFESLVSSGAPASADRLEAAVDLSEVTDSMKGKITVYDQNRDGSFSGPGQINILGVGEHQAGGSINVPIDASTQIVGKYDSTNSETQTLHSGEAGVEHKINDNWRVAVGTRVDDRENAEANASPILSQNGARTDVALTVGYQPTTPKAPVLAEVGPEKPAKPITLQSMLGTSQAPWDLYGYVQDTVTRTETRPENDRAGLGGSYQVSQAARVGAEVSDGSLGVGGKLSTDYKIDARSNVYVNYTLAADQPDALYDGRSGTLTTGTRYRYSDATSVYGEERMQSGTGPDSLTHAYGVDFTPSKQWTYGLKFERGVVSDPLAGDMSLTAASATVQYTQGKIKYGGAIEWRDNDSNITGASRTELVRNSLSYQVDPDWRLFGKLNWSQTDGVASTTLNAEFHEFILGAAWRPILDDRWNVLFKFTSLDDQPSTDQLSSVGNTIDYAQQSVVADIDANYQVLRWLSIGVKYAIRTGELKQMEPVSEAIAQDAGEPVGQTMGQWYYSQTQLWVVRGDLLFPRQWDAMVELRRLSIHETDDVRTGVLVGGYRHLNNNFKIGAGYNFTNYSDNLTDLSYRSHGFFLDTIGKF
jgi:outer membrane protein OmpA-like peptidoglycan-associated protein